MGRELSQQITIMTCNDYKSALMIFCRYILNQGQLNNYISIEGYAVTRQPTLEPHKAEELE